MTTRLWPCAAVRGHRRRAGTLTAATVGAAMLVAAPALAAGSNGGANSPPSPGPAVSRVPTVHHAGGPHARRASSSETPLQQVQRIVGVTPDGAWGSRTARALKRWQAAHGLRRTGVTDIATVRSLGLDPAADPPLPALTPPSSDALTGPPPAVSAELSKIAACESSGDPHQLSYHGTYRGLYQFDMESWFRAGGLVDPAQAPAAEQTRRAAWILATQGRHAWPNCS